MLSFLVRLIRLYQDEHGFTPNVLYINDLHYQKLRESLAEIEDDRDIARLLRLEIIIRPEAVHPHVAWQNPAGKYFMACG